ncbi:MAG: leucine-rich repeat domain-containing protein, partial [Clostridia bacterium]|nr:leucine-rich repeat domain-containing protein [Clostridia bacterium]
GTSAFAKTGLTSVTIPNRVTSIGSSAFDRCGDLTSVTIGSGVTSIGNFAFTYTGLTSVTIPDSVKTIGNNAFANTGLTSVTIGSGVTSIGYSAFAYTSLTSVIIPDSVKTIGNSAFQYCGDLTTVTLGSGVETIGQNAFRDCGKLTSVTIPVSVKKIDHSAFLNCTDVTYECCEDKWAKIDISSIAFASGCTVTFDYTTYSEADIHWHKCNNCEFETAKESHTPADDGDCTTDVTCSVCGWVTSEGADSHTGGTATCTAQAVCEVCGTSYGELAAHSHSSDWSSDAADHWHECGVCDDKADLAAHSGGTATCAAQAACEVCGTSYGELAAHSHSSDWSSDAADHWHECSVCNDKADLAAHSETTVGAKAATASQKGYTGDTVCSVCGYEIAKGKDIPLKSDSSPATGDESGAALWLTLLLASSAGLAAAGYRGRKRKAAR